MLSLRLRAISLLLLALSEVNAIPVADTLSRLSLTSRYLNGTGSFSRIVDADRARIAALKHSTGVSQADNQNPELEKRAVSVAATNAAVDYTAPIGIGSPATIYALVLDTSSSVTWVSAASYKKTSTSTNTGATSATTFGCPGTIYTDTITIGSLAAAKQRILVVNASCANGVVGALGLGTENPGSSNPVYPSAVQGVCASQPSIAFGLFFAPATSSSSANGELTVCGYDSSKYTGSLGWNPVTTTSPSSAYWGVNEAVSYNGVTILTNTAGIVDADTTLIYLATNAFNAYIKATGGVLDTTTGLYKITAAQYTALKPLNFVLGSTTYSLSANAQIWPRSLNTFIGGAASSIYLIVADLGSNSGAGLDFINGYVFLERFYSAYDYTNARVGFATTAYTSATSN